MQSFLVASLAALAVAAPLTERASGVSDGLILQYALTLEHLEATFYREAIAKFTVKDFEKAGLGAPFLNNLKEIALDEKTHVDALTAGLKAAGATPVAECTYDFGYTDVKSFLAVAGVLEGVGVSAYLGAAASIVDKTYLTIAGSILTVEARHSAYLREHQHPSQSPFPAPFDIPLDFNNVFTLAAPFIKSCPSGPSSSLTVLGGFKAFPSITVSPAGVAQFGQKIKLTVAKSVAAKAAWLITSSGALPLSLSGSGASYETTIPANAQSGQAYLVLTGDANKPTDDNTVAGPAVFNVAVRGRGHAASY